MKSNDKPQDGGRRQFLSVAAKAGVGVTAVMALPATSVARSDEIGSNEKEQKGYRTTEHILQYYKSTA
ncbi:MAG: formate dehydrogenase [Gammaproteobacteria bacterium]|nr:formate dehydrogenase [Gammaproteobacteria bacterium]